MSATMASMHVTPPKPEQATVDHTASPEESVADTPASTITLDFLAPAQNTDELGRLGHYRILKVLGKGGMGMVFLAEDTKLDRHVALKVMLPKFAEDKAAKQRFLREAKTAAKIEHDHIVHIYQVDEDRGVPFLAMQLLSGSSLEDVLKRAGRLKPPQILRLGAQIAEGLSVAHAKGLIHRDIKPANIWVEANYGGRVKLLDFGLARTVETDIGITQSGAILGTPAYMPPEQARGEKVDHRCDLYALGCVLYRMATAELPIKGKDTMALLMALALNEPTPPRQMNETIPPGLNDLIMKLLHKDAAQRPGSAKEVALALKKMEQELARASQPSDVTGELVALAQPPAPPPRSSTLPEPPSPAANLSDSSTGAAPPTVSDPGRTHSNEARPTQTAPVRRSRKYAITIVAAGLLAVIAAAIVIFVQTDYGSVRIEIHDPAIEVSVKGEDIVVKHDDQDEVVRLRPGPKTLVITRGAFTLETDKLSLQRGATITVEVRVRADRVQVLRDNEVIAEERLIDYALHFDAKGTSAKAWVPYDGTQPLTLEAWIRITGDATGGIPIVRMNYGTHDAVLYRSRGKIGFVVHGKMLALRRKFVASDRFIHVAGVWDGKAPALFIDGQRAEDGPLSTDAGPTEKHEKTIMYIGFNAPGLELNAVVDEVRVSQTARYDKEFFPQHRFEPDKDTLALYHFDEGVGDKLIDSSGNGHHGKIVGAKWVKVDEPGIAAPARDVALEFDGKTSYVEVPSLRFDNDQPVTLEGVVTLDQDRDPIVLIRVAGSSWMALSAASGKWGVVAAHNNQQVEVHAPNTVIRGVKTHVAGAWDGKELRLFVNGKQFTDRFVPIQNPELIKAGQKGTTQIGGSRGGGARLVGKVHGLRVSKIARYTQDFVPPQRLESDKDTFALYRFDEGQGEKLIDSSGNSHHGKIVGAKWVAVSQP